MGDDDSDSSSQRDQSEVRPDVCFVGHLDSEVMVPDHGSKERRLGQDVPKKPGSQAQHNDSTIHRFYIPNSALRVFGIGGLDLQGRYHSALLRRSPHIC